MGDATLTPREWEVLALLREGLSNPEIAARLDLSIHTVKTHIGRVGCKLGMTDGQGALRVRHWLLAHPDAGREA